MDAIDRQLLDLLRANARLSYAELARQVGLSAPAVHERVGKLENAGVIRGYHADVDPESIDLGVTALVRIVHDTSVDIDDLVLAIRGYPEVESCYFLAGDESLLLKLRVATIAELERLVVQLGRTAGVASTRTTIALSTKWESRPRPLSLAPAKASRGGPP
ncbi:Lrp/AsnC family transcriptional regulator [Allorhizocola rhizosphaerae]|uniref:Lrp/AsnC family transcriptional regulator n=1 Tax=Allorhizocola rhizosphaerae TaxID=1872709 RepID=UPI000E3C2FE2|nr:Lrp/AsnC family transcriptional regulator [Allorhizocola rhizosphaerae]